MALLVVLGLGLLSAPVAADDWARPEPTGYASRGFAYVAEIFPPHSRRNPGERPLCYIYEVGHPGLSWEVDARLRWRAPLVNAIQPYQALLSPQGDLVTLNEHGHVGYENAVVIYGRDGSFVKAYALEELLPPELASGNENEAKFPISMSSRWWNHDARYYFLERPRRLYVVLPWGFALELRLDGGAVAYAPWAAFAELSDVRRNPFANEEAEMRPTSLRFASITDVLAAKDGGK
jgi:hypothetical protein